MTDTKYFYYFQGRFKHTGLYKSWVDEAREEGVPMEMVTVLPLRRYIQRYAKIKQYANEDYIRILPAPPKFKSASLVVLLFFAIQILLHDRVVVHVRKRSPRPLDILKSIFGDRRMKYIIDFEGDPVAERDYLLENEYEEGFYETEIQRLNNSIEGLPNQLKRADRVITVTESLRDRFERRYPSINLAEKISVIPSGVNPDAVIPSEKARERYRHKLGWEEAFILTYVGGAHYSWQNVKRTIEIYDLVKREVLSDAKLLLLVREKDHHIVQGFLEEVGVDPNDFVLREVPHREVGSYLNAADMGVLLRDAHPMNEVVTTAKLGEYLLAGLPVLTTRVAYKSDEIESRNAGIVLDDMDDDDQIVEKFSGFLDLLNTPYEIRKWASGLFTTTAHGSTYANLLREMGQ